MVVEVPLTVVPMPVNRVLTLVPKVRAPPMMTSATSAAARPYSRAVMPLRSLEAAAIGVSPFVLEELPLRVTLVEKANHCYQ